MILGRMVYYYLPEQKVFGVHATKFSLLFVLLDIVSFLVQAVGGIIVSGNNVPQKLLETGKDIYMSGIGLQELFILCFFGLVIAFHRRVLVLEQEGVLEKNGRTQWRRLLYTLYISLILITVTLHPRFTHAHHS